MARRPYVAFVGDRSGWPATHVPTPATFWRFDQFSSELVNGDDGGSWAPADPITLGPQGSPTLTLSTAGSVLSGDIETLFGNARAVGLDVPGLVLTGAAAPAFVSARSRTVVVPFSWGVLFDDAFFDIDPSNLGLRCLTPAGPDNEPVTPIITVPLPMRAQHRGSTIESVDFRFVIFGQRSFLPNVGGAGTHMPRFRVIKVTGDTAVPLHTAAGSYDAEGWYSDPAATPSDYYANGQTRLATYTPNQNNTGLDPTSSFWAVQFQNEVDGLTGDFGGFPQVGFGAGNTILSATVHLSAIADFRQE